MKAKQAEAVQKIQNKNQRRLLRIFRSEQAVRTQYAAD